MKLLASLLMLLLPFSAVAEVKTEPLKYSAGEVEMIGHLAYDDAQEGKRPAVLVVHEWWGLGDHAKRSAEKLAGLGYVALAVDMYGGGKLTDKAPEAQKLSSALKGNPELMRERFMAAMDALKEIERVDYTHIGAMGYCFGGTTVLEMARVGAPVQGVVSFHGGLKTAWSEIDHMIGTSILVCHGANDPFVKDEEVQAFVNEMRTWGTDWQLISYGGAVHSFTNPEVDKHGLDGAKYDKRADERSWADMTQFFAQVLK